MQHAGDPDRPHVWIIDNQVGEYRPEFYRLFREIFTSMAGAWCRGQKPESVSDLLQHLARDARTGVSR